MQKCGVFVSNKSHGTYTVESLMPISPDGVLGIQHVESVFCLKQVALYDVLELSITRCCSACSTSHTVQRLISNKPVQMGFLMSDTPYQMVPCQRKLTKW